MKSEFQNYIKICLNIETNSKLINLNFDLRTFSVYGRGARSKLYNPSPAMLMLMSSLVKDSAMGR